MSEYISYQATVTRPVRAEKNGDNHSADYRTVARAVACEIYTGDALPQIAPRGDTTPPYAQAIISPKVDIRDGDRLIDPLGQVWDIQVIMRTKAMCRCALRAVYSEPGG